MEPAKPRISVQYIENNTIVAFTEERILEETDIKSIQSSIMSVIEQSDKIKLIINFDNVKFLSSAVLGLLIRISRYIYEKEGQLRLCGIDPKIYKIFKITRLTNVFEIYNDLQEAVESLANSQ